MPAPRQLFRIPSRTLLTRLVVLISLVAGVLFVWTLSTVYEQRKLVHRHQAERELQTIGRLQAQAVANWRANRLADASALTDDSLFAQAVARWQSAPPTEQETAKAAEAAKAADFVQERLRILRERARYSVVSFVAPDGTVATDGSGKTVPAAEKKALADAMESAAPAVVEPRRSAFFAFPFFSLMAPIFDGTRPLGAVWLVMDVRTGLYPLLTPWPTASETAESVLIQAHGQGALLLTPLRRHDPLDTPNVIPASDTVRPMVQAIAGARGLIYGRDDRGIPVMAVVNAISESPWFLVSQIEVTEAFGDAATRELLVLSLPVSAAVLVAGVLLGGWQWRARRRESALKDKLAQNMQWLESAQKAALVGYYVYERADDRFTLSPMASELFGLAPEAPVARAQWLAQVHPSDRAQVLAGLDQALRERKALRLQYRVIEGKRERWVDMWGEHDTPSANARMTGTVQDITERQHAEEKLVQYRTALEALVRQDPMTGVANRRALTEALTVEWQRAARMQAPLSVLMIDVDHFKAFNDRYGHLAGDECLRKVARALVRTATRATDLVARYGGEEFAVLLPATGPAEAKAIAEKLRLAVHKLAIVHAASGVGTVVTVSIGVATAQTTHTVRSEDVDRAGAQAQAERESQHLLHQADQALYLAKESGRDTVVAQADAPELTALPPQPHST